MRRRMLVISLSVTWYIQEYLGVCHAFRQDSFKHNHSTFGLFTFRSFAFVCLSKFVLKLHSYITNTFYVKYVFFNLDIDREVVFICFCVQTFI